MITIVYYGTASDELLFDDEGKKELTEQVLEEIKTAVTTGKFLVTAPVYSKSPILPTNKSIFSMTVNIIRPDNKGEAITDK